MLSAQTCHRSAVTKDPVQHLGDILDSPPANAYIITFQCQTLVLQTCSITFTKPDHFESIKSLMKMLSPNAAIVSASTHQLWNGSLIDLALPFTYKQIMNEVGFKVMHDHNRNFLTLVWKWPLIQYIHWCQRSYINLASTNTKQNDKMKARKKKLMCRRREKKLKMSKQNK